MGEIVFGALMLVWLTALTMVVVLDRGKEAEGQGPPPVPEEVRQVIRATLLDRFGKGSGRAILRNRLRERGMAVPERPVPDEEPPS